MGKKKIVLDTNILISALGWKGNPHEIFKRVLDEEFELLLSEQQLEELKEVMNYPRLKFTEEQKSKFLTVLLSVAKIVKTSETLHHIKEDPDDDLILECATENKADYLISGDEHLLTLKTYLGIKIVTATEFLEENIKI